jgi:hypothetical protein
MKRAAVIDQMQTKIDKIEAIGEAQSDINMEEEIKPQEAAGEAEIANLDQMGETKAHTDEGKSNEKSEEKTIEEPDIRLNPDCYNTLIKHHPDEDLEVYI